ncbi:hypothetical protein V8B55DRAFT_1444467 [Mucor lusitanicus]|uniref:Sel1 repeat family protein n=1 Tax=Mucor circinelloides f. lusitanicus TaxID=29924 RepID=A0A8H4F0X8_MUCCL|nr:hypothetical protein FB192DRAFT_1375682 [Mucor lusitanicus]
MSSDYQALLERGRLFETGKSGFQRNYFKAYQNYEKVPPRIERGESYYRIGELLMEGDKFLSRDYNAAKSYYEEAGHFGHGEARYALGQMYEQGRGMDVDYANAKRYYHQALDVGYTEAAKDIGIMFLRAPPGVIYDLSRAKIYLERFEEHYVADAEVHIALGDYYRLSRGRDYISKASERYNKAIALNEGLGYYWIGQMWEQSSSPNLSKAVGYYQAGKALSSDAKCMWRLGQLHVSGQVLKKDIDAARILFVDAVRNGCEEAKKDLDKLDAKIAKGEPSHGDTVQAADVGSNDTPANPVDSEPSTINFQPLSWDRMRKSFEANGTINFQPLSWDRMRACFEANGAYKHEHEHEQEPNQTSTSSISETDDKLVKIIKLPANRDTNVTNFQVRSKINEQCPANPSKLVLQDSGNKSGRGYKFKTKADLQKQLKKANVSSPISPFQMLELSTALLQSNQAQITAALDTTNKALLKNTLSLTLKLNKLAIENEQSAAIIDSNNQDIAQKFDQVEESFEAKYKQVSQRLDVLEKESVEKDKTIASLISKLNTQSQQLDALMRSMERR